MFLVCACACVFVNPCNGLIHVSCACVCVCDFFLQL